MTDGPEALQGLYTTDCGLLAENQEQFKYRNEQNGASMYFDSVNHRWKLDSKDGMETWQSPEGWGYAKVPWEISHHHYQTISMSGEGWRQAGSDGVTTTGSAREPPSLTFKGATAHGRFWCEMLAL